jgi:hypothetical protein
LRAREENIENKLKFMLVGENVEIGARVINPVEFAGQKLKQRQF